MSTPRETRVGITEVMQLGVLKEDAGSKMLMLADILFGYENRLEHEKRTRVKHNHLSHSYCSRKVFKG